MQRFRLSFAFGASQVSLQCTTVLEFTMTNATLEQLWVACHMPAEPELVIMIENLSRLVSMLTLDSADFGTFCCIGGTWDLMHGKSVHALDLRP